MKGRILAVAGLLAAAATSVQAQASCQTGSDPAQNAICDATKMGSDVFALLTPQLGLAMAGGNATIGQGGTLGGFPHFVVSVRGNVLAGDMPDFANFPAPRTEQTQPARTLPSKNQVVGMPVVDAAIGVFKGLPLGLTNVGGVDLLVSAAYVPKIGGEGDDFRIEPEEPLQLGFGARVGVLQESLLAPGVSVTYIRRDLPTTDIFGSSSDLDLAIENASIKTSAWRVVASKSLLLFGLAAGVGQDTYDVSSSLSGVVHGGILVGDRPVPRVDLSQKMTRTNMFLDASMNLPFLRIVGEIGRASGGDLTGMVDNFSGGEANQPRVYGSVGVRFGI